MPNETETKARTDGQGYVEDPDFVPKATDVFATVDTSGTAGIAHSQIEEITPVFEVARRQDLAAAARALDPDDPTVSESLVTLPQGTNFVQVDPEAAKENVLRAAQSAEEPVDISAYRGPAARAAEEETDSPSETDTSGQAQAEKDKAVIAERDKAGSPERDKAAPATSPTSKRGG